MFEFKQLIKFPAWTQHSKKRAPVTLNLHLEKCITFTNGCIRLIYHLISREEQKAFFAKILSLRFLQTSTDIVLKKS